jgi:hypothetical protein
MSARKALISIIAVVVSLSASVASASIVGEFRGYVAVNRALNDRIMKDGSYLELGYYVGQSYDMTAMNLLDLLGTFKAGSAGARFRNGSPNSLNMLLWHLLLSGLSRDFAKTCAGDTSLALSAEFAARLAPLCAWPQASAMTDAVLLDFWLGLIAYDAPLTEFYEWKRFVTSGAMSGFKGAEAVEWISLSVLNNPYFLLRP